MIIQAIILALTLNSTSRCDLNVEVRQAGRLVSMGPLAAYASQTKRVPVSSLEPLDIRVSGRNCSIQAYRIQTPVLSPLAQVKVDVAELQYMTIVNTR